MLERRKIINRYLNEFIPNVLSNLISEYDYYFIGKSEPILENQNGYAYCCAVLSDDQKIYLVTKSHGYSIGIWNMQTEIRELSLEDNISTICDCFVLSDGRIATISSYYYTLKIWNPFGLLRELRQSKTGECDITFESDAIRCCTSLSNNLLVTGGFDGLLKIWNVQKRTKKLELTFAPHYGRVTQLHCISLSDNLIVSGSNNGELKIWSVQRTISGELTANLEINLIGHINGITCCAISSNGRLISGSFDKTLRIWNVQTDTSSCRARSSGQMRSSNLTGKCELILTGHTNSIFCCAILPDERIVSGSYDGILKIWNSQTGNCELSLKGDFEDGWYSKGINFCSVLPDGRLITGSAGRLKIWR
jgi:WD40 repeat protein